MTPRILVIATLTNARFLPDILRCFEEQSYPNKQLLLVCRADTIRELGQISQQYEHVWSPPGVAPAVNLGIDYARRHDLPLWARFDQDDWYGPRWLDLVVDGLSRADVVGLREHDIDHISATGELLGTHRVHAGESSCWVDDDQKGLAGATLGAHTTSTWIDFPSVPTSSHFFWLRRMRNRGARAYAMGADAVAQFRHRKIDGHDHVLRFPIEQMIGGS